MAANYFVKLTPEIKAESSQEEFVGQLEVLSFSYGVSQSGGFSFGSGGGVAAANCQDLSVSFRQCAASPKLMEACASGKHFDDLKLTCLRAAGDKQEKYLEVTLTDVVVSSYQSGGSGDDMPIESASFNYVKIKMEYYKQDDKGIATSAATGQWDQAKKSAK